MSPQSVHRSSRGWQTANQINKRRTSLSRINRRLHNESTTNGVLHGLWDIAPASDASFHWSHAHTHDYNRWTYGQRIVNQIRQFHASHAIPFASSTPLHPALSPTHAHAALHGSRQWKRDTQRAATIAPVDWLPQWRIVHTQRTLRFIYC